MSPLRHVIAALGLALLAPAAPRAQPAPAAMAPAPGASIAVGIGAQRVIDPGGAITRLAVGNPQVADVSMVGRQIRVLGLAAGTTDLVVWRGNAQTRYRVSVAGDIDGARALAAADPALAGIAIESEGGRVVLRGSVPSLEAHQRLLALARQGRGEVLDLTRITSEMVVAVEVKFAAVQAQRLQQLGFNFRSLGTSVQGSLTAPGNTVSSRSIGSDTYVREGGSAVPGLASLAAAAAPLATPLGGAFNLLVGNSSSNLLAALSLLSSTNFAQVLAEPVLLVRSGEQAAFLAGGEIPVPVPVLGGSFTTVTIDYKPFGVRLDVAATVMSDGRILLRATPEVSELDYANAVTLQGFSIPAFRKRAATTTLELASGQSFMLAGLTLSNLTNLAERVPGVGQLPVIGSLFSRTNASRDQQELVIIATPRLVRPLEPGQLPPLPGAGQARPQLPNTLDFVLQRNTPEEMANRFGLMR